MAVRGRGARKQCQKIIKAKPETRNKPEARCRMPLDSEGKCPIHGSNIGD